MSLHDDLRELAADPVSYGQETHGELHADSLAYIERCEEAIRKILGGSEPVRHQGLVEAARIYNEARGLPTTPKTGFDALSDADKAEWAAMIIEQRNPDTKACGCGYPKTECLRVVLRNGPPYPPRPCEPKPYIGPVSTTPSTTKPAPVALPDGMPDDGGVGYGTF